jgi:hypothetical protein
LSLYEGVIAGLFFSGYAFLFNKEVQNEKSFRIDIVMSIFVVVDIRV